MKKMKMAVLTTMCAALALTPLSAFAAEGPAGNQGTAENQGIAAVKLSACETKAAGDGQEVADPGDGLVRIILTNKDGEVMYEGLPGDGNSGEWKGMSFRIVPAAFLDGAKALISSNKNASIDVVYTPKAER